MTPEEVLLNAADEVSRCGHHKGWFYDETYKTEDSPVCAMGAINRVIFGKASTWIALGVELEQLDAQDAAITRLCESFGFTRKTPV